MRTRIVRLVAVLAALVVASACGGARVRTGAVETPGAPTGEPDQATATAAVTSSPASEASPVAPPTPAKTAPPTPRQTAPPTQRPLDFGNDVRTPAPARTHTPSSQPPSAHLRSSSGEADGVQGSSCWKGRPDEPGLCTDVVAREPTAELRVRRGEELVLSWATGATPTSIRASRAREFDSESSTAFDVAAGNPARFSADFDAGVWYLHFLSYWEQGDVAHSFKVRVE